MMQTLESMRRRIEAAQDLYAVVRVMKALAASSIRQCEKTVESIAEYSLTIEAGLQIALRNRIGEIATTDRSPSNRWGIIVFGSDQGMCGSFNEQVAHYAMEQIRGISGKPEERGVVAVGLRIAGRLEDAGATISGQFSLPSTTSGITSVVNDLLVTVEEMRFQKGIERLLLIHQRPSESGGTWPITRQLLPVDPDWLESLATRRWPSRSLPTFTMDWHRLFSSLIRQHLFVALYRAFAESLASENANRLASMQAAEKNIQSHLSSLILHYHQGRQQSITEELLDIVAGFETLTADESLKQRAARIRNDFLRSSQEGDRSPSGGSH